MAALHPCCCASVGQRRQTLTPTLTPPCCSKRARREPLLIAALCCVHEHDEAAALRLLATAAAAPPTPAHTYSWDSILGWVAAACMPPVCCAPSGPVSAAFPPSHAPYRREAVAEGMVSVAAAVLSHVPAAQRQAVLTADCSKDAAVHGDEGMLRLLVQEGAPFGLAEREYALFWGAELCNIDAVRLALSWGGGPAQLVQHCERAAAAAGDASRLDVSESGTPAQRRIAAPPAALQRLPSGLLPAVQTRPSRLPLSLQRFLPVRARTAPWARWSTCALAVSPGWTQRSW